MKLYRRENYLKKIRGFYHDTGIIKVITGVRRCGKSCLMETAADEIRESGVLNENIIYLNLDKRGYRNIKPPDQLDALIESESTAEGIKYLFIDEIQNVEGFEEVINGYREEEDYSIFITGSNSYLLSGELATKLTGRYLEFELYTLSFEEYLEMKAFMGKDVLPNLMHISQKAVFLRRCNTKEQISRHTSRGPLRRYSRRILRNRQRYGRSLCSKQFSAM